MKRRKQILFLLSWNDYRIFQGISRFAHEAGWRMDTRHFFTNQFPQNRLAHDGMIAMGHRDPAVNAFVREKARTVPTVVLGTDSPGLSAPKVVPDNRRIARLAAQHLYDLFHKGFGWFACDESPSGLERREAFLARLAELGMPCADLSGGSPHDPAATLARLKSCQKPIGVMCRDDHDAAVLLDLCQEARLRVPEEVAVVGVGDLESLCSFAPVPMTSIPPDMESLGYQAASVLDRLMRRQRVPDVTVVPPGPLVRRFSTGCLAITHPRLKQAVRVIDTRFHEALAMEEIAAAAGVSRRQLYNLFQKEMRGPPHRYILDVRLENAKKRIGEGELSLHHIARACGFNTSRTLNRVFQQRFGMAPSKWARTARTAPS